MTKREKAVIVKALRDIMDDHGDFSGGIAALCRLIGNVYPADSIARGCKVADFRKLASGPNQSFEVTTALSKARKE